VTCKIAKEKIMLNRLIVCAVLLVAPFCGFAQTAEREVTFEVDATVRSVDPETRRIVLDNSTTGESEILIAGPEIVNFDQIEAGDKVKAVYTVGLAARMALPGEMDSLVEVDGQAAKGEKPGAMTGTMVTLILEFLSFDPETSIATVKDSSGAEQRIEVATEAGRDFTAELNAGDKVALSFTEGLAVGIVEK
jgi:hypothetical protein